MNKKNIFFFVPLSVFLFVIIFDALLILKASRKTFAEDFKCLRCHKGKDSLERYVKEKKSGKKTLNLL